MKMDLTFLDLFCGAGGLSAGFQSAGYQPIFAADSMPAAVRTYDLNFAHSATLESLTWGTPLPTADVFVGGPPCQGFSSAGRRVNGDARNSLVAVFANLVARHRPKAFLFENVEGFLTGDRGQWVVDLIDPLVRAGYCINICKINAANYGVPQHRKRVVALGGLGWDTGFPPITHRATGTPGAKHVGIGLPYCPTVEESLDGLPTAKLRTRAILDPFDHNFRLPQDTDLIRISKLKPGQTMKDLPEELWHKTYRRRAYRRVMDGTPTEHRGGAPAGLRRLIGNQPSKTITSGAISEFVHPIEDRMLTLRECARLQTFADNFSFEGTLSEKALLIGNAVPPRLAMLLGLHLSKRLLGRPDHSSPGLKSFVVSNASIMSPSLKRTYDMIAEKYLPNKTRQFSLLDTIV